MDARTKAISKLRALAEITQDHGATPAEEQAAIHLGQRLREKHAITLTELSDRPFVTGAGMTVYYTPNGIIISYG